MPLTPEICRTLRAPFAPDGIKWKVQTNPREGKDMALVVAYIDARDVAERLDEATGGDWSNEFSLPQVTAGNGASLECRLTVCGVTRCDVGTVDMGSGDATKDLHSDALKRAAVLFGVGAHLYRLPKVYANVKGVGRSFVITPEAQHELVMIAEHAERGAVYPRFTHVFIAG